jgi:hypothetical protein
VLALAEALSQWAEVTVVFRRSQERISSDKFHVMTIEPYVEGSAPAIQAQDDVTARGFNPLAHLSYLHTLRYFARQQASAFDLVFEKGWRLSGWLLAAFRYYGVPGVLVENDARYWSEPLDSVRGCMEQRKALPLSPPGALL